MLRAAFSSMKIFLDAFYMLLPCFRTQHDLYLYQVLQVRKQIPKATIYILLFRILKNTRAF